MNRNEKTLELDKVLQLLANRTAFAEAREEALKTAPVSSIYEAQALLDETSDAHMLISRFGAPSFGGFKDVSGALARADAGGVLSPLELLRIAANLRVFRMVCEWRSHSASVESCLNFRFNAVTANKYLEERISSAILSEEEISDNASFELSSIRRKINAANNKVRALLDKIIRSPSYKTYLQDAIITQRNGRFVVPVKNEHRSEIHGMVHDTSSSGATVFIEPAGVVEANNEIKILLSKEQEEIERILAELSADAASFREPINLSGQMLTELNVIFAKAQLAFSFKATVPLLNSNGIIDLKKARHPLIDPGEIVPTDISLGEKYDTLIITGPNTGGKTVALKTMGLITLMAMCGLMIPAAENSRVSVFDHVLADIGDEQSIEQSLSTFSSHMVNIVNILQTATNRSLILMDELGAGTDPVEGAALAIAILENLHVKGARVGATTHYAELKEYAVSSPHTENGCCEFDIKTLRPTYRLLIGVPGRSNAFAISERLGLPASITDRAKEFISGESRRFEDVVAKLEDVRQEMEQQKSEAEAVRQEAAKTKSEAEGRLETIEQIRNEEIKKAQDEAKKIVYQAKMQYESFLNELDILKKQSKKSQTINKSGLNSALGQMEKSADPVTTKRDDGYVLPRNLVVGDSVLIFDIDKKAVVLREPDEKGMAEVQAGIMKTRVDIKNLRLIDSKPQKAQQNTRRGDNLKMNDTSVEIDLRGQMVDDALLEIDRFIDQSVMGGMASVTIIHGKGTGALRKAVHVHLRHHPSIRTFRLGTFGEGESGVTIAELK